MNNEVYKIIAALFVDEDGVYADIDYIDVWGINRDARKYDMMLPVIAHPPCQLWGALASVNYARWGGEHNRPGNDLGCFEKALYFVNKYGGVLEHPANSKAFAHYDIAQPSSMGWQSLIDGGWVCEVWQSAYGHRANKATWLYYNGKNPPHQLNWDRIVGSHQIGGHDQRGKERNKPTLGKKEASATPIKFMDELIKLASRS